MSALEEVGRPSGVHDPEERMRYRAFKLQAPTSTTMIHHFHERALSRVPAYFSSSTQTPPHPSPHSSVLGRCVGEDLDERSADLIPPASSGASAGG
ncbi:hypothetical protein CVT26_010181 [Gymnopilus dilepis]|uniref:Uncharacterized protein n=1 Tax=Gymnopilus dilepis TaxID=231916 RepID=A0A409WCZ8_9AGAR|nr:hypothetical protein CVT26_010181 [Gymnopilus dilepis]